MSLLVGLFLVMQTTMQEQELHLFLLFYVPQLHASYASVPESNGEAQQGVLHVKVDLRYGGEH